MKRRSFLTMLGSSPLFGLLGWKIGRDIGGQQDDRDKLITESWSKYLREKQIDDHLQTSQERFFQNGIFPRHSLFRGWLYLAINELASERV